MNKIEQIARASDSQSFKKRNPHLFKFSEFPETLTGPPEQYAKGSKKRIRQSAKPLLNRLEEEYLSELSKGSSRPAYAQAIRFRLGNGIWYKPDFVIFNYANRTLAYEIKGPHAFRGGFENLKVAASLYPAVKFILVWKDNATGKWIEQEVLP